MITTGLQCRQDEVNLRASLSGTQSGALMTCIHNCNVKHINKIGDEKPAKFNKKSQHFQNTWLFQHKTQR
jgi:hypothetical protein